MEKDVGRSTYSDFAIQPVEDAETEKLEIFELNDSARAAVAKAKKQADRSRKNLETDNDIESDKIPVDAAE